MSIHTSPAANMARENSHPLGANSEAKAAPMAAPSAVPANRLQDRFHDATSEDWTATIVLIVAQ
jgi:hypothetical protein